MSGVDHIAPVKPLYCTSQTIVMYSDATPRDAPATRLVYAFLHYRPLIVLGKGAAMARAEGPAAALLEVLQAPFLGTAMGRGVLPDSHALNVNAARSTALAQADVAVIVGARCVVVWVW